MGAGDAGASQNDSEDGGAAGATNVAGASGTSGTSTGGVTSGGGSLGAPGGSDGAAASPTDQGGAGGSTEEPLCIIEFLHLEVSGGMAFERSTNALDECGLAIGGKMARTFMHVRIAPPEVQGSILATIFVDGMARDETATFTPSAVTVIGAGSVWTTSDPNPGTPLQCSLKVDRNEPAPGRRRRVAGSLSCPSALSGRNEVGGQTTLDLNDFRFSFLGLETSAAAP